MTVAEKVIAALADLPDDQQTVVLDFVEALKQKRQTPIDPQTPIWEKLLTIAQQIPDPDWQTLPTDLSLNFDSYQTHTEPIEP
jgi:hypothetical protein